MLTYLLQNTKSFWKRYCPLVPKGLYTLNFRSNRIRPPAVVYACTPVLNEPAVWEKIIQIIILLSAAIQESIYQMKTAADNSLVNMPDLIWQCFVDGYLWPLQSACSQNRAWSYEPDLTFRISFSSLFPKTTWIILYKTDPDLIWMAWSGFGQTHLVWKWAGVQESLGLVSGRTQPARYQFPTFRLSFILLQTSWIILCKTSLDPIWLWLIVSCFGQTDLVRKQANVQESSSLLPAIASQLTRCKSDLACLQGPLAFSLSDCGPFIAELLGHFEDPSLRQDITAMLIPRSRLDIGELIGKGWLGWRGFSLDSHFKLISKNLSWYTSP